MQTIFEPQHFSSSDLLPPEIAFLQDKFDSDVLKALAKLAHEQGVSAETVLLSHGHMTEQDYYKALAKAVGCPFEPEGWNQFDRAFLARAVFDGTVPHTIVPLAGQDKTLSLFAAAPIGAHIGRLLMLSERTPEATKRLVITTPKNLIKALQDTLKAASHARASNYLKFSNPQLSAASKQPRVQELTSLILGIGGLALLIFQPIWFFALLASLFSLIFAAHSLLKLLSLKTPPEAPSIVPLKDADLPRYSVLVPLYKEGKGVIGQLREALLALNYPRAKLSIYLITEEDDPETHNALSAYHWPREFDFVVVPAGQPRTKPKAMNVALSYVNTPYLTIYDAEDIPEPDQLRKAAAHFAAKPDIACLQARLSFFNARTNWLTAQFAIEYASLFDHILPAFERLGLPLPLGGTSNHFRVSALKAAGAWDPYNVTEDADLGVRLKGLGYETSMLDSETQEEATSRLIPWHRQRTRWQKGWLQTWAVHMRAPIKLYKTLGPKSFFGLQAYIGGLILAPIAHLLLVLSLCFSATPLGQFFLQFDLGWQLAIFVLGYGASLALAFKAARQKDKFLTLFVPTLPLYWLLTSFAAINSFFDLARRPFYWAKTPHGYKLKKQTSKP